MIESKRALSLMLLALAAAASCGVEQAREDEFGTDSDSDGDTDTDTDTDTDSDSDSDSDADASSNQNSCRKVDVVISIDASSSMIEEHQALRDDVFPAFADRLQEIAEGLDNFRTATLDACPNPANLHTRGAGGECSFEGGNPWIESTSATMDEEFACVGDLYLGDLQCTGDDDDEQPAAAVVTALESPWLEGQNAGFLRDDALLVVVAMTDEDEQPTFGGMSTAVDVFERISDIKGGTNNVVFLGIGGSSVCEGPYGPADEAVKLRTITDLFITEERGVWWNLCDGNLEDGLESAFAVIEEACEQFIPVE